MSNSAISRGLPVVEPRELAWQLLPGAACESNSWGQLISCFKGTARQCQELPWNMQAANSDTLG